MAALPREAPADGHVFEDIADAMPHMVWLADPDGGTTYHNRRILEYTGLPAGLTLGAGWERLVHPDDVSASRATWLHSVGTGEPFETEYRLRRYDGVYRRFLARAHTQLDSGGAVVRWVGTCTDIEDMRRTAELLKAVANGTTDAVFVKDRDGKYLLANPATARFVGRADGDLLGRTDAELFDPDSARLVEERDRHVMTTGVAETNVEELTAAGVTRTYLATKAPYRDEDGTVIGVIGITRDVTELKRSEESLRASEERQALALRGAGGGAWDWNLDTGDIWWSPELYELWGVQPGTPMGIAESLAAIHEDDREAIHVALGVAIDRRADYRCEFRIHHPVHGERWMASYGQVARDQSGRPTHLLGISLDVTERKRLAEERDALLARLQLQFERMPLAYVQFDADLRVTDWNPAAERIFGFRKDEVLGMGPPYEKIVPESFRAEAAPLLARIQAGDMGAHSVNPNLTKDGRTITCEWFNTPLLDEGGRFTGLLCLAQDLTERLLLEEQFMQAQKMEAVGQLAGGVAHDFNNLLTIISGYSELLLDMMGTGNSMRESVTAISEASERAASLTRQLLAFSRKTVLSPKVLDLNDVVRETEKLLRRLIGEDVLLTTVLDAKISKVKVDPGQLGQILMNLAVNARDAMTKNAKLTIETRNVVLDREYSLLRPDVKPGSYVMLSVSDNGIGMTAEVKARIFEPFYTTKQPGEGTGLGLAVVLGIVKQSNGHVDVDSEPGLGTTFKIYFPSAVEKQSASNAIDPSTPRRGTEKILLVEDEDGVRGLAVLALQTYGYKVLAACNGKEMMRLVEQHKSGFDLMVTDVVMPGMSGPDLAKSLRPLFPLMKVVYCSGYTDDAVVRHGILQEKVAFLQKPYTPLALVKKVRQVLDGK